jgi:hypothetical protein
MRLSLKKGAHAALSRAASRKSGASREKRARCGAPGYCYADKEDRDQEQESLRMEYAGANMGTRPGKRASFFAPTVAADELGIEAIADLDYLLALHNHTSEIR